MIVMVTICLTLLVQRVFGMRRWTNNHHFGGIVHCVSDSPLHFTDDQPMRNEHENGVTAKEDILVNREDVLCWKTMVQFNCENRLLHWAAC